MTLDKRIFDADAYAAKLSGNLKASNALFDVPGTYADHRRFPDL